MNEEISIAFCNQNDVQLIVEGINEYNLNNVPAVADTWTPLNYVICDKNGDQIAGIIAGIGYWNGLEIKVLWVKEGNRNNGLGSKLLRFVENEAKKSGAVISMLDTYDFQAKLFYSKHGYETVGVINNFPAGHSRIYLSKRLTS